MSADKDHANDGGFNPNNAISFHARQAVLLSFELFLIAIGASLLSSLIDSGGSPSQVLLLSAIVSVVVLYFVSFAINRQIDRIVHARMNNE